MPWWSLVLLVPCVFSLGFVAGCFWRAMWDERALTLHDADEIYERGVLDGRRRAEMASLERMARR